ncbi:MAG: adenine deaminase [Candidatus Cloacimonadota bacterium]|nr:MAG: adenine deaminase [Candidatus Cloacimonadota bacterium]
MEKIKEISGNIVDVVNSKIYGGTLYIENGKITEIKQSSAKYENYVIPGFIDAHIHVESSMLTPAEFARIAAIHGTIAVVSDPHEIANILGIDGINFMLESGKTVPIKFYFGAPSCVPATEFETSGAKLDSEKIKSLLKSDRLKYLSEVMNFPGVISNDPDLMKKVKIARDFGKPVDGHAPGLRGKDLRKYIKSGISTDHECFSYEEAEEKIRLGMKILIREGSAAKNFKELIPLLKKYPDKCMFCCDDKHPNDLLKGHINELVKRAVSLNYDVIDVLKAACLNPVLHYKLDVGLLKKGDSADFLVVNNLREFEILKTVIDGKIVAENSKTKIARESSAIVNNFHAERKKPSDFFVPFQKGKIKIIEVKDKQLLTGKSEEFPKMENGGIVSDINRDILKIAVVNRYKNAKPAIGFVKNFGLKKGAIASSIAHDSHNIISVGTSDEAICEAVNLIIENRGGICAVSGRKQRILPLPIGGIISNSDYQTVAKKYSELDRTAKEMGSKLSSPFMTLSFMALLVIPELKISDKGLFDAEKFTFVDLFSQ